MDPITCPQCGELFKYRSNKKYCSARCKSLAWVARNPTEKTCHYCGAGATQVDNSLPRFARPFLSSSIADKFPSFDVPACRECANELSSTLLWTLSERKAHIKHYLKIKYWNLLHSPDWTKEELDELGDALRASVDARQAMKKFIQARISY